MDSHTPCIERLRAAVAMRGLAERIRPMVGDMAEPGLPPASFDLVWSEGALYNIGIENALRVCHGLLRAGGYLAFTDAVWRKENPPTEVRASFEDDYPTMGRVPDVLAAIEKCGFSLIGHFTLPDEAWRDDFYTPMEIRIKELRGKHKDDDEALAVLDQLAREPAMHRKYADYYAYEFFVVRRMGFTVLDRPMIRGQADGCTLLGRHSWTRDYRMNAPDSIDAALGVEDLRAAFLSYTRHAYALLPAMDQPRFLDIGCGSGQATIELARLSGSQVVGIDSDATALAELRRRIELDRLGHRVEIVNVSLFDVSFADEVFDVLWEEGVLHLLDSTRSLPVCRRLLKPGGFLVMHETVVWFEGIRARLSADGFGIVNEYLLPKRCWWTDYYAPLEDRIRLLREERGRELASEKLAQYEREIAMVKANPDLFDCGFFILQKL